MHPEVIKEFPDICPECGMDLQRPFDHAGSKTLIDKFVFTAVLTSILLIYSYIPMLQTIAGQIISVEYIGWIPFVISTPVVIWGGYDFFIKGWHSVRSLKLNMFTLISLGIGIAYIFSTVALLFPEIYPEKLLLIDNVRPMYFDAAAAITTLVILGQVIENRAERRTNEALHSLRSLTPRKAWKLDASGQSQQVPLSAIAVGDLIEVKGGETIPVDGLISKGEGSVDESIMTGESHPIDKKVGDKVIAGSTNSSRTLEIKVTTVGNGTVLSKIISLVAEAQSGQIPVPQIVNQFASVFVPLVVLTALITFMVWFLLGDYHLGIINAITVLIIACPCAIGLATPMSMMVGIGRGAQAGIIFKDARSLQQMYKADTLLIDKTGTLTWGKPRLVSVVPIDEHDLADNISLAASAEKNSDHPLARAIVDGAMRKNLPIHDPISFTTDGGKGIQANVNGKNVIIGNDLMMSSAGIDIHALAAQERALHKRRHSVLYVAVDGKVTLLLGFSDQLKPSSQITIAQLQKEDVSVMMITGDQAAPAQQIAEQLGIKKFAAEVLPDQKLDYVKTLQQDGHIVMMAGDGVNDAPALAQADVSIAMGTGSNIALESAGVTLLLGNLKGIVRARKLSRLTMQNVKLNLVLAVSYNALCIPIAAGVFYQWGLLLNPVVAAAAMSLSSLSVILNALRLRNVNIV